ncbi:DUF5336 domain-containing protein [Streptomyces minutiscleroticus]|uniref:Uncharacterized protein n=1 Tax=Streptomyces minutiscleroticus TaxID=68238 RepID=A0A918N921_9ACTN|nr:DUF5336 domain-containing protein [Streptomyces minutiscleroticus]GGX52534.1 hypothetical protein GCM10010358_02800 [Streptomyces minutiscleroticus]
MNIRSLTRGDGVVIGAAVLLFIASFLDIYSIDTAPDGLDTPNAWGSGPILMGVVLAGIVGAALVVLSHGLPRAPKIAGLELAPFGTALTVFAAWSALANVVDPPSGVDNIGTGGDGGISAGIGLILALIATLLMAAAAIATPMVPALKAALVGAPRPQAPQPYGAQPPAGYGYPGAQQQPGQPYGAHPQQAQQPYGGQPQQQAQAPQQAQQQPPAADFSPFWFAVPVPRPLYAEDGSASQIAELAPGTWYLAVEQRGAHLVAQTQDGRRGVLQDTTGIQRG